MSKQKIDSVILLIPPGEYGPGEWDRKFQEGIKNMGFKQPVVEELEAHVGMRRFRVSEGIRTQPPSQQPSVDHEPLQAQDTLFDLLQSCPPS